MFSFDPNKIDWDNQIDTGSFGIIYPYKKTPEDERFVVKYAHISHVPQLLGYFQEIVLGFSCKHQNVLPVRGYHIDYDQNRRLWHIYVKLDRMKCSLKSRIQEQQHKNKNFSQKEIVNYLYEMSCGLEYLHDQGIAHRDIKPANILISKNEEIKIADIGLGKFVGEEGSYLTESIAGTSYYTAPEIQKKYAPQLKKQDLYKADIWSLGVVMAELCLLKLGIVDIATPKTENEKNIIKKLKDLEGKIYDKDLLDLIVSLIRSDPTQRKSLHDIKKTLNEKFRSLIQNEETLLGYQFEETKIEDIKKDLEELKEKREDLFQTDLLRSDPTQVKSLSLIQNKETLLGYLMKDILKDLEELKEKREDLFQTDLLRSDLTQTKSLQDMKKTLNEKFRSLIQNKETLLGYLFELSNIEDIKKDLKELRKTLLDSFQIYFDGEFRALIKPIGM